MNIIILVLSLVIICFCLFVLTFVNNLVYLKRLKELLAYLQNNHKDEISNWEIPAQLLDSSPKRVSGLLKFLKSPEYFNDGEVKELKEKALKRLNTGYILFGLLVFCSIILFVTIYILKNN